MRYSQHMVIITIALLIAAIGIVSVYSATYHRENEQIPSTAQRQFLWVALGLAVFAVVSNIHYRWLWDAAYLLYAGALLLLALVIILGSVRLGAQRWLQFAWFTMQPSEMVKLVVVVFLARYFSKKSVDEVSLGVKKSGALRGLFMPLVYIALPMGLIIEQPDLGTGMMLMAIFITMLYLAGVKLRYIIALLVTFLLMAPLVWMWLRDYQKERLLVFLNPDFDPLGAGYTIIQSKIAIGSGGLFGKGWLSGTQSQLRFLPESHTDFVFATFAEEWGVFGCCVLLFLYYLLVRQGMRIALQTNDTFARLTAFGISLALGIQVFVNIAMNLGLAPVVGLPLPLMSYGGSSMVTTFIALGILTNISKTGGVF